jgi:hypothetical protein
MILVFAVEARAADETRYTKGSTAMFDGARGKVLGSMPPGAPVQLVEKKGRRSKIVVEGWSAEHNDLEVFANWDVRRERVTLARLKEETREVTKEKKDRWDTTWRKVRITGWVDSSALVTDVAQVWKAAKLIHTTRCTICHPFKAPDLLTASQWRGTLVIMAHRAALTPEEEALIKQYLQKNARPPDSY